jgi:hypothetical protein
MFTLDDLEIMRYGSEPMYRPVLTALRWALPSVWDM